MFKEMRRKDKEMDKNSVIDIVKNGKYGIMSTVGDDGYPYGIPLNYVYIDNNIYFHCAPEGHKINNLKYNEKVSFCIVELAEILPEKFTTKYRSAVIFGKAREVLEEKEKKKAFMELIHKYSNEYTEAGERYIDKSMDAAKIFKIEIEDIKGKKNN